MWQYTPQNRRDKLSKSYRWVKSPISKHTEQKWRLRRDFFIITWNFLPLKYEIKMYPCGDSVKLDTVDKMNRLLEDIGDLTKVKDVRTIIFVQQLDQFLRAYDKEWKYVGEARISNGRTYNFCAISEKFEFRNLEPLMGSYEIEDCDQVLDVLIAYNRPIYKIVWSMAHMAMKSFYTEDLRQKAIEDVKKNKRYFNDPNLYRDMFAGSSSGLLYMLSDSDHKILKNVSAFDKRSAYPWILLTNDHFPLTKVKQTNFSGMCDAYEKDKWFTIVLRGVDLDPKWDMFRGKGEEPSYAWNLYDYKTCDYLNEIYGNRDLYEEVLMKYDCKYYTASKCGYLMDEWREAYYNLYVIKNSFRNKDDPDRTFYKTQLDMMYGKGLQDFGDLDESQLIRHYKYRGDKYILPHWSKMVVSALKYEMVRTFIEDQGQFYADTDGIKSEEDVEVLKELYLGKYNAEIMQINKKAGFGGCNIGTWDHEYTADRFCVMAKKQYAYEINGKPFFTVAGVPKESLISQMQKYYDPLKALCDRVKIYKSSGVIYRSEQKDYIPCYEDYVVGDNYYEELFK